MSVFLFGPIAHGQTARVLHYTETSGYDHQTRAVSYAMFTQMGSAENFIVERDSTGDAFNSLSNLKQYKAVIFSNTSGDQILNALQKQNFEDYMKGGGGFIGIHAASDTYRHSLANGSNTGGWDWYAEMLGASVQSNPNHVNGTPVYKISSVSSHPILTGIPDPWHKAEEFYYWQHGYFNSQNTVLQKVEQTLGPNLQVNSYDSSRAVSWCKILPEGGRSFYTALGHATSNYSGDATFYTLLRNALSWVLDKPVGFSIIEDENGFCFFPVPASDHLTIKTPRPGYIIISNSVGKEIQTIQTEGEILRADLSDYVPGIYVGRYCDGERERIFKFYVGR